MKHLLPKLAVLAVILFAAFGFRSIATDAMRGFNTGITQEKAAELFPNAR